MKKLTHLSLFSGIAANSYKAENARLESELEKVKAERDAAVADLNAIIGEVEESEGDTAWIMQMPMMLSRACVKAIVIIMVTDATKRAAMDIIALISSGAARRRPDNEVQSIIQRICLC